MKNLNYASINFPSQGDIKAGPFSVSYEIISSGINIKIELDYGPCKESWTGTLSFSNSSKSFSFGSSMVGASISVSLEDKTGNLEISGNAHTFGRSVNSSITQKIMPANTLGLLACGITFDYIINDIYNIYHKVPLTYDNLMNIKPYIVPSVVEFVKKDQDLARNISNHLSNLSKNDLKTLSKIPRKDFENAIIKVAKDPRIQKMLPYLAKNLGIEISKEKNDEVSTTDIPTDKILETITMILTGCAALAVLSSATFLAIGAILIGIGAASSETGVGVVILVIGIIFFVIGLLLFALAVVLIIIDMIIKGVLIWTEQDLVETRRNVLPEWRELAVILSDV